MTRYGKTHKTLRGPFFIIINIMIHTLKVIGVPYTLNYAHTYILQNLRTHYMYIDASYMCIYVAQ